MKERPMIFSIDSVRAILDGRKTQTRRLVKLQHSGRIKAVGSRRNWHVADPDAIRAAPWPIGDRIWVRETFLPDPPDDGTWCYYDYDDGSLVNYSAIPTRFQNSRHVIYRAGQNDDDKVWRSPIFMPRWASRLTLEVTNVRIERLRDISEEDAEAEGVCDWVSAQFDEVLPTARDYFSFAWDLLNGKRASWQGSPYVWVIEFEVREKTDD